MIKNLIEEKLGTPKAVYSNETIYSCPNGCGFHLSINYNKEVYCCVICGLDKESSFKFKGAGSINSLLKYLEINTDQFKEQIKEKPTSPSSDIDIDLFIKTFSPLLKEPNLLLDKDREYLLSRGISLDSLEQHKFASSSIIYKRLLDSTRESQRKELLIQSDKGVVSWIKEGRILIPYICSNKVLAFKSRSTFSLSKMRYLWSKGSSTSTLVYNISDLKDGVIITEGEIKALITSQFGFPCAAIPGISSAHEYLVSQLVFRGVRYVRLCFDTEEQAHVQANVNRALASLTSKLNRVSIEVSNIKLPSPDGHKIDLDDFLKLKGVEEFRKLLND